MKDKRPIRWSVASIAAILITHGLIHWSGYRLIINTSPSMPEGIYLMDTRISEIQPGDIICLFPAEEHLSFMIRHRYIGKNIPLLKTVYATEGDVICIESYGLFINGMRLADVQEVDSSGVRLPVQHGCYRLKNGQYFAFSDRPYSYDSRYFGPVTKEQIQGTLTLLFGTNARPEHSAIP